MKRHIVQSNWLKALADTYDACAAIPGVMGRSDVKTRVYKGKRGEADKVFETIQRPLLPIHHTVRKADVAVHITRNGKFVKAERLTDESTRTTIIPVNQDSVARTIGPEGHPHPLMENIPIITFNDGDSTYLRRLEEWVNSKDFQESPKDKTVGIMAVYEYVKKKTLLTDLKDAFPDEEQYSALVATMLKWVVDDLREGEGDKDLGKNENVWNQHIKHYEAMLREDPDYKDGFCYATGVRGPTLKIGANGLVAPGDRCKLFPVAYNNMKPGTGIFTNLGGLFTSPDDCCQVNEEVAEKAQSVFRWLYDRQSWSLVKGSYFPRIIVWDPTHPQNTIDVDELFGKDPVSEMSARFITDDATGELIGILKDDGEVEKVNKLRMASNGYVIRGIAEEVKDLVIMTVDGSEGGARIAVTGFSNLSADQYIDQLIYWHKTTAYGPYNAGLTVNDITSLVVEKGGSKESKSAKSLKRYYSKSVLQSINTGRPLPADIVRIAFNRTINTPSFLPDKDSHETAGELMKRHFRFEEKTCALLRKSAIDFDENGGCPEFMKTLDESYNGRDYLYDRALACIDTMERRALFAKQKKDDGGQGKASSIKRTTNAWRLMPRYFQMPATTLTHLMMVVNPYMESGDRFAKSQYILRVLNDIVARISEQTEVCEGGVEMPLGTEAMLGYHWQMNYFNTFKGKEEDTSDAANDEE